MNLSFESKVALVTGAAGASATVAMTHIAIQEALNGKMVVRRRDPHEVRMHSQRRDARRITACRKKDKRRQSGRPGQ